MKQVQENNDDQESILHIIIQSLQAIDHFNIDKNNNATNLENILYSLIQMFRHLQHDTVLSSLHKYSKTLKQSNNVFKNILSSPIDFKLDLSIILFAYLSIYPDFNQLIIYSDFQEIIPLDQKHSHNTTRDSPLPTVFSIIKQIENFKTFDKKLLSFLNWDISRETVLESWIQSSKKLQDYNNNRSDISTTNAPALFDLLQNEVDLHFYLINYMSSNIDPLQFTTHSDHLILKLYHRIILLDPKWVPRNLYNQTVTTLLNIDKDIDSLEFNLQVLMELIDHPEYNLLEMPKFVILLYLSLSRLKTVPSTQLHEVLTTLGTTQTLLSLLNMSQFIIARFLNSISLVSKGIPNTGSKSVNSKTKLSEPLYKIPGWFQQEMLPDIPPISKSLFVFDTSTKNATALSLVDILTILHQCLNLTIIIHNNIIDQYHALKLNLFQHEDSIIVQVEYLLKQQFFQNNYIPLFSTLLTLINMYPHENIHKNSNESTLDGSSSTPVKDQFYQMLCNSNFTLHNIKKLITFNSIKYIESLIISYKDIALYHLLKFISLISQENLFLQKISIKILNHLFFHNNDNDFILTLCQKNELSFNELSTYIKLWNDGTTNYTLFYSELLNEKQPMVDIGKVSLRKLQKLIPNLDKVIKYHEDQKQKVVTHYVDKSKDFKDYTSSIPPNEYNFAYQTIDIIKNNITNNYSSNNNTNTNNVNSNNNTQPGSFSQTIQPTPQKRMKNYMSVNKYDAYTSQTFIPSGNNSMNNSTLINTNNTFNNSINDTHDTLLNGCYTPQAQQLINSGSNVYSTPLTYIQQQQQQSMTSNFNGISMDNSNPMNMNFQSMNQNEIYNNTPGNFPIQSSFMGTSQNISLSGNNNNNIQMLSPTNVMFASPWNDSSMMSLNTPQNKIVNTGKDYILGGHHRMQNNSRAQSIHIDQFENI